MLNSFVDYFFMEQNELKTAKICSIINCFVQHIPFSIYIGLNEKKLENTGLFKSYF